MKILACIAHEGEKAEVDSFTLLNLFGFKNYERYTIVNTRKHLKRAGREAKSVLSGLHGGDAQLAAMLGTGNINSLIFYGNPLDRHPLAPDVQMLMRLRFVHIKPFATKLAISELLIKELPDNDC